MPFIVKVKAPGIFVSMKVCHIMDMLSNLPFQTKHVLQCKKRRKDTNLQYICNHLTTQPLTQFSLPCLRQIFFKRHFLSSVLFSDHSKIINMMILKILVDEFSNLCNMCFSLIDQSNSLCFLQIQKETLKIFFESLTAGNYIFKIKSNKTKFTNPQTFVNDLESGWNTYPGLVPHFHTREKFQLREMMFLLV